MTPRAVVLLKLIVAATAVVALVAVPVRELVPTITIAELVFYMACAFVGLLVLAVCSLQLAQFILRKGGTDPQWFWFNGNLGAWNNSEGKRRGLTVSLNMSIDTDLQQQAASPLMLVVRSFSR